MVFHWSLSDNKSLGVSRTILSILAICSNLFIEPLAIVLNASITISISVTFMFHSFLYFSGKD